MPNPGPLEVIIVLGMFALMVVVGYGLIASVVRGRNRAMPAATSPRDPAMDALRTRLANGDIDEAEFRRLRDALQSH